MTAPAFDDSYDELAVLRHQGASDEEITRREAERALLDQHERFLLDVQARAHVGPTLDDHRRRWAAAGSAADGDSPPDGTMAHILGWVGGNPQRAAAALTREQAAPNPRTSLIRQLRKLADG